MRGENFDFLMCQHFTCYLPGHVHLFYHLYFHSEDKAGEINSKLYQIKMKNKIAKAITMIRRKSPHTEHIVYICRHEKSNTPLFFKADLEILMYIDDFMFVQIYLYYYK